MRHTDCMIRQWVFSIGLLVLTGCAAVPQPAGNSQDVILEAPEAQVRAAFVRVLTDGGYDVEKGKDDETALQTGYRQEIHSYSYPKDRHQPVQTACVGVKHNARLA